MGMLVIMGIEILVFIISVDFGRRVFYIRVKVFEGRDLEVGVGFLGKEGDCNGSSCCLFF